MTPEVLADHGGGACVSENTTETNQRYIFIDPDYKGQHVSVIKIIRQSGLHKYESQKIWQTRGTLFWHEHGEAIGPPLTPKVIKYENLYRIIIKTAIRPVLDSGHSQGVELYQAPSQQKNNTQNDNS